MSAILELTEDLKDFIEDSGCNAEAFVKNFSDRDFRNAMGRFPTGVVVVSTLEDGKPHAMTANAFMSGSLEPPLVIVSIGKRANTHDKIQNFGHFGISILAEHQDVTSNHFAGRKTDGYEPSFEYMRNIPVIEGAAVQLITRLHHSYPCGDHTLFVGQVLELKHEEKDSCNPLLFHSGRYSKLSDD